MAVNEAQRAQWNAESQARTWPKRERITTSVTPRLLEALALRTGENVLDVGCGGGLAAMDAAQAVGASGFVTGFDLSAPLVGLAQQRAAERNAKNVTFIAGDAQVDAISGAPFDAVMSQFGVMFFADPVEAFTNIRRHMKPGGRIAFACWQSAANNAWWPGHVLAPYAPPPPPTEHGGPPPGPFAFADHAYVERILTSAGFRDVSAEDLTIPTTIPDGSIFDEEAVNVLRVDQAKKAEAWAALMKHKETLPGDDGMLHVTLCPRIVRAANP